MWRNISLHTDQPLAASITWSNTWLLVCQTDSFSWTLSLWHNQMHFYNNNRTLVNNNWIYDEHDPDKSTNPLQLKRRALTNVFVPVHLRTGRASLQANPGTIPRFKVQCFSYNLIPLIVWKFSIGWSTENMNSRDREN